MLAIAVFAGCSARITAGVAADTSGGIGPRFGLAVGYGTPRPSGRRVRRPTGGVAVAFPGGDESLVDIAVGYERLMLPAAMHGLAYRLAATAGWLGRDSQDENLHEDRIALGGAIAVTHARASRPPPRRDRPHEWYAIAPIPTVRWQQYGVELGALVAAEPDGENAFGLAHLSALFELSSWPDRR